MKSGEDIHLSATCKLKAGIPTICPMQNIYSICGNLMKDYSFNQYASWRTSYFLQTREKIFRYLIDEKAGVRLNEQRLPDSYLVDSKWTFKTKQWIFSTNTAFHCGYY